MHVGVPQAAELLKSTGERWLLTHAQAYLQLPSRMNLMCDRQASVYTLNATWRSPCASLSVMLAWSRPYLEMVFSAN